LFDNLLEGFSPALREALFLCKLMRLSVLNVEDPSMEESTPAEGAPGIFVVV